MGDLASLLEGLGGPKAALEVPKPAGRGQEGARSAQGRLRVGWGVDFGPTWAQHGPNLGPKNDKKPSKNYPKNYYLLNGLRDPTWGRFWWILRPKMEPCWLQNRFQNGC